MRKTPDYGIATNAAYETLSAYKGAYPVIDIFSILKSFPNVMIKTYSEAAKRSGLSFGDFCEYRASSRHGFTIRREKQGRKQFLVYYNDYKDETTVRFTLAHETGHIVLDHEKDGEVQDKEANCFARNILCPVPLIKGFEVKTVSEYMKCFDISEPFAKAALQNFPSDEYYITRDNYQRIDEKAYCSITGFSPIELY